MKAFNVSIEPLYDQWAICSSGEVPPGFKDAPDFGTVGRAEEWFLKWYKSRGLKVTSIGERHWRVEW